MATRPHGILLNSKPAQCSIYESGRMFYDALRHSPSYSLDYLEISSFPEIPRTGYDFYAFNYHHVTMAWLETKRLAELPGKKLTFVLEMLPDNPFVFCPKDFDAYCVPDPTHSCPDPRVFAFPRPLECAPELPPHVAKDVPWIGSFGFATPGKGFEVVVHAANREFERAVVRLNIPSGTYADPNAERARQLGEFCRSLAKPGIEVRVDHRFLPKQELIAWCAENTLNVFFYHRNQPGLSATTDQAVVSGRPLLVSPCDTFRHIHEYIRPYPGLSLRGAIATTGPAVARMQNDWAPQRFSARFATVLSSVLKGSYQSETASERLAASARPHRARRKVLFVNHSEAACGIHQFGKRIARALAGPGTSEWIYCECDDARTYSERVAAENPDAVVFNYYPATMPWVSAALLQQDGVPCASVLHEICATSADSVLTDVFDLQIAHDPTLPGDTDALLRAGRPLALAPRLTPPPPQLTIGSFGFALPGKGFARVVTKVEREFDDATIRLHIPRSPFADPHGKELERCVAECRAANRKPGIRLELTHDLLADADLLEFLAGNSLNVFLYAASRSRGISSVLDLALAVDRPIAITKSAMFRHLHDLTPSICIEDRSLGEILASGTAPLGALRERWSPAATRADYERLADRLLGSPGAPAQDLFLAALARVGRAKPAATVLCADARGDDFLVAAVDQGVRPTEVVRMDPESALLARSSGRPHYDLICGANLLRLVASDRKNLHRLGALLAPGGHAVLGADQQEALDPAALQGLREQLCAGVAELELAFAGASPTSPWILRRRLP